MLLGDISPKPKNEDKNLFRERPRIFPESTLPDRFQGFLRGRDSPRLKENLKARG